MAALAVAALAMLHLLWRRSLLLHLLGVESVPRQDLSYGSTNCGDAHCGPTTLCPGHFSLLPPHHPLPVLLLLQNVDPIMALRIVAMLAMALPTVAMLTMAVLPFLARFLCVKKVARKALVAAYQPEGAANVIMLVGAAPLPITPYPRYISPRIDKACR